MTTRYTGGFNNAENGSTFGNMPVPDPVRMQQVVDDFSFFSSTIWTVVETQAGATQAMTPGAGGRVLFTNSAAIADVNAITTPAAVFKLTLGKKFAAKCRCSVSNITNVNAVLGLMNAATTLSPADGIFVSKVGTLITVNNVIGSTTTTAGAVDTSGLAANQMFTLGLEYDGRSSLSAYFGSLELGVPDRKIVSLDVAALTAVDLLLVWGMKNVNAVANTATLDYVAACAER